MINIWSDKKIVNIIMNISLLLLSMNFLHYGQLLLPIMCLILFVDNKFKFKVNNIKIFFILCLFAILFCGFSYKRGIYCIISFFLPMAYYVGSNIQKSKDENLKIAIYIISFGMSMHCLLDFSYDLFKYGIDIVNHQSRYDFWTQDKIAPTIAATNMSIPIGTLFYLMKYEENRLYKKIGLSLIAAIFIYNLFLGRRTQLLMCVLVLLISYLIDIFLIKAAKINYEKIFIIFIMFICVSFLIIILCTNNIFGTKDYLSNFTVFNRFIKYGFESGRINLLIDAIKIFPYHLFGNQEVGQILNSQIHETWLDILDYGGIFPYVLFVYYSINCLLNVIKCFKNRRILLKTKILILNIMLCITIQMFVEPILTSSSIFLLVSIIIVTIIEKLTCS